LLQAFDSAHLDAGHKQAKHEEQYFEGETETMTTRKVTKGKDKSKAHKFPSPAKAQPDEARAEGTLDPRNNDGKLDDLRKNTEDSAGEFLTTNQGVRINDNQNSLKAGERGATLLEDFILREKITHFDHERIPERVVHARGSAAHGYFQV